MEICCSFFRSEHGKSESDGETGVIKTSLRNHILEDPDANIYTARDIVNFGNTHLGETTVSSTTIRKVKRMRSFHCINEIRRSAKDKSLKQLYGTRVKVHQVKSTDTNHQVLYRYLSCFCKVCVRDGMQIKSCPMKSIVGEVKKHACKKDTPKVLAGSSKSLVKVIYIFIYRIYST